MQIPHPFDTRARHGYALMVTLVFLAITLMTLASLMWWASSNGKVTQQNELFTTAEAAAEAAAEQVVATLDPTTTSWAMSFQFSDGSGNNNKTGITIGSIYYTNQLGSTFANLAGYVLPCTITSTAIQNGQLYSVPATVEELVNADIIPCSSLPSSTTWTWTSAPASR